MFSAYPMADLETRTFRQPATQGHRSRQEDAERSNDEKCEADGSREVHFKGYSKMCQLAPITQDEEARGLLTGGLPHFGG